jgi:hypothetical protein
MTAQACEEVRVERLVFEEEQRFALWTKVM